MTAYERRVVHVALRDDRRVATASEGDEPFRMVVISPK
jgi:spoIIIJ-associated protein